MPDRPDCIAHWTALERAEPNRYQGDDEPMGYNAPLGQALGLARIGIHHRRVPPGQRISFPHAESAEEEFVYVIEGTPDVWLDGRLHRLRPGDAVGFPAGTGIAHTFINNGESRGAAARRRRGVEGREPHRLSGEPGAPAAA